MAVTTLLEAVFVVIAAGFVWAAGEENVKPDAGGMLFSSSEKVKSMVFDDAMMEEWIDLGARRAGMLCHCFVSAASVVVVTGRDAESILSNFLFDRFLSSRILANCGISNLETIW